jgi:hypothetical protein
MLADIKPLSYAELNPVKTNDLRNSANFSAKLCEKKETI